MSDKQQNRVQQAVLNYIDHLEDTAYLNAVLSSDRLIEIVDVLLRSSGHEVVGYTTLFLRDSIMFLPDSSFSQSFFDSPLVLTLEGLVLDENLWIRNHAVYTLGKSGCVRSLPALHRAFDLDLNRDPIFLPRLVGEVFWLEAHNSWVLLDRMMASREYTVRWAVIGILSHWGHGKSKLHDVVYKVKLRSYRRLRNDRNPLIQAEADYRYRLLVAESPGRIVPKAALRSQREIIARHKPLLTFDDVEVRFTNHLGQGGLTTYTIPELEDFIAAIVPLLLEKAGRE